MRAYEFITEAKTTREDFEGMTIEMVKNGHVLVIHALDDWGNNILGSVAFNIGDDNELDPQDLKVDERYQGQGIARIMYDYAKSKGYEIHRSYDQTDAGAGFWNKHRGEDVRIWEAFDNPYKGKWEKSDYGDVDLNTKLPDGTNLSIMFNNQQGDEGEEVVQVEFYRNNSQEVTGEGDAQRIFATVLDAIQKYIKKYKPQKLSFSASKATDPTIYYEPDQPQPNPESRAKLYDRLVQRYSKALGYRAFRADNGDIVIYELSRIKQGVAEARSHPNKNIKWRSGRQEVGIILRSGLVHGKEWGLSMTMLPKLGINPGKGISEDTPKGIYFYPLGSVNAWVNGAEELPWGNDFPYIQVFQYDTSHQMTPNTKVDPEKLKAALRQYCPEEVINQLIEEGTYNNDPYWFIYNCLIQVSKNDESTIVRWNKVLRDLGFTSVYDYGKGWIAYNEPEQGIILDPRIIKQVRTIKNYTRKQGVAEGEDKSKDPITNAVIDFYQHVGKIHKDPIDDYVSTAKEMLGHVSDPTLKSKLVSIFRQAKENPYIQGGVVTTIGALLAGGVLSSAQRMGLNPSQTNLALQAILNTVIPTVVSRINGKSWADTAKYTLASAGIGTGIAGIMDEERGLAPTKPYDDLMANMGYFMSLNTVKIQQDAVDNDAQQALADMQQQFRKPILNGMSFFDVNRDTKISKNPKVAPILLKYVYDMLGYIEPRIKKYIKPEQQGKYLDRLDQIKNDYRGAVAQVS